MVWVNGSKFACGTCIKGHRSSTCTHTDRELIEIKKKGRPPSQCQHCRQLRQAKGVHSRCVCEGKAVEKKQRSRPPVVYPNGLRDATAGSPSASDTPDSKPSTSTKSKVTQLLNPCLCKAAGRCSCCSTSASVSMSSATYNSPGSPFSTLSTPSTASSASPLESLRNVNLQRKRFAGFEPAVAEEGMTILRSTYEGSSGGSPNEDSMMSEDGVHLRSTSGDVCCASTITHGSCVCSKPPAHSDDFSQRSITSTAERGGNCCGGGGGGASDSLMNDILPPPPKKKKGGCCGSGGESTALPNRAAPTTTDTSSTSLLLPPISTTFFPSSDPLSAVDNNPSQQSNRPSPFLDEPVPSSPPLLFAPSNLQGTGACWCGDLCACPGCKVHDPENRKKPTLFPRPDAEGTGAGAGGMDGCGGCGNGCRGNDGMWGMGVIGVQLGLIPNDGSLVVGGGDDTLCVDEQPLQPQGEERFWQLPPPQSSSSNLAITTTEHERWPAISTSTSTSTSTSLPATISPTRLSFDNLQAHSRTQRAQADERSQSQQTNPNLEAPLTVGPPHPNSTSVPVAKALGSVDSASVSSSCNDECQCGPSCSCRHQQQQQLQHDPRRGASPSTDAVASAHVPFLGSGPGFDRDGIEMDGEIEVKLEGCPMSEVNRFLNG